MFLFPNDGQLGSTFYFILFPSLVTVFLFPFCVFVDIPGGLSKFLVAKKREVP